jgi:hypothetical protein
VVAATEDACTKPSKQLHALLAKLAGGATAKVGQRVHTSKPASTLYVDPTHALQLAMVRSADVYPARHVQPLLADELLQVEYEQLVEPNVCTHSALPEQPPLLTKHWLMSVQIRPSTTTTTTTTTTATTTATTTVSTREQAQPAPAPM